MYVCIYGLYVFQWGLALLLLVLSLSVSLSHENRQQQRLLTLQKS